jgi:hypothetical protein
MMQAMPDELPLGRPQPAPMDRVRRIARWVRAMALVGGVLLLMLGVTLWMSPAWVAEVAASEAGIEMTSPVTPAMQWGGALVGMVPVSLGLFALFQVWQLFGDYGRGAIFTPGATLRLRRLAWSLIGVAAVQVLARTATGLVLTMNNPPGQKMLVIRLSSHDYVLLLFGVLLLAIAWVMVEATRLAQENAEFV